MDPEPLMEQITPRLRRLGKAYLFEGNPDTDLICEIIRENPRADRLELMERLNDKVRERIGRMREPDDSLVRKCVGNLPRC